MSENDDVEAAHPSTNEPSTIDPTESSTEVNTPSDAETETPVDSDEELDQFIREHLGDEERLPTRASARRAARRGRPRHAENSDQSDQPDLSSVPNYLTDQSRPAQPTQPTPIDVAFKQFQEWIEEREKMVARRVQKSGVALDDVARMGALVLVHLKQKYPTSTPEQLRPLINAALEPLEYNMRFGAHKTNLAIDFPTELYLEISLLSAEVSSGSSLGYRQVFSCLDDDAAKAETVFRALREATKPRPDPSFRPTAWLTADEDLVRTHPVPQGTAKELMGQLHDMTGLDSVKNVVRGQAAKIQVDARRAELGLSVPTQTRHVLFHGNPGTGKTTVARIIAGIYRSVGLLHNDHIVETDSSGLVSKWRGNTPQKTNAAIDEALGGVLFIDEAYSLVSEEGQQAIDTLVKRMEDDREDLIVILAGYPDKMAQLLDTNPGLASRIGLTIDFPDYTNAELMDILDLMLKESDYEMTDAARMHVQRRLESVKREDGFGNARTVRNVFESATSCQAIRLGKTNPERMLTLEQVIELTAGDFDHALDLVFKSRNRETGFGFGTPGGCVLG